MTARDSVRARVRGLYMLLDADTTGGDPLRLLDPVTRAGCRLVQLRCKGWPDDELLRVARELVRRARPLGVTVIVNDRPAVAAAADADGVHVGQLDAPAEIVRSELGPDRIIGRSTHDAAMVNEALAGADYVAFGPIFPTERLSWAKPQASLEALAEVRAQFRGPLVAIGGITDARLPAVKAAGADAWAVIGAVTLASDPFDAARRLC